MDKRLQEIVKNLTAGGYIGADGRLEKDPAFIELKEIAGDAEPEPVIASKKGKSK